MLFLGALVLAVLMPATALAGPSATLASSGFGPNATPSNGFCNIGLDYQWTGFNNAAYYEVYIYDVTLGVAYGLGYDANGNKTPIALGSRPYAHEAAFGTVLYIGHTVEFHADLLSKGKKVIAGSVATLPTIVNVSCPS
jgi:hypothetical protein